MKRLITTFTGLALCAMTQAAVQKPNIVLIFSDDQGYNDLGCYGSPDIRTPNIDKLASDGMRFTDFYMASSVCSASRAALLTGCYPKRVANRGVFFPNKGDHGLSPSHVTIAEVLKASGYATKAIGKWHLGDKPKYLPTNQGFDSYYGIPYSNDMSPAEDMKYADDCLYREGMSQTKLAAAFAEHKMKVKKGLKKGRIMWGKVPLMRNEECVEFPTDQTTITKRYTDEGITFISDSVQREKPFFLYLANSMPHVPLYASPQFKGKSKRGPYGDVIEEIDYNVGRVIDHLKKLKIDDNTIVIFTSDNGPWLTAGKRGGSAYPLFEGKFTQFEGGQRVPAIIKWPGRVPAGSVCSEIALSMDLLPTLAHFANAELPAKKLDGKNISTLLTGKNGAVSPHEFFFYGTSAVRFGDWKYHAKEGFKVKKTKRDTGGPTLYNLKDDIGESKNAIATYPEIAERLRKKLQNHRKYLSGK